MKAAGIPQNDAARLEALRSYAILDTGAEEAFDALTKLSAYIVDVPIALFSLVDAERQWFKSKYGLDATETARDVSFCGHVVESGQPLIVGDALSDERFSDNPLVLGDPQIRFYAGIPVRTHDGFVLGSLCAIDRRPREITAAQRAALTDLATQAGFLLELRKNNMVLTQLMSERHKQRAEQNRLFALSQDLMCTADTNGYWRMVNPAFTHVLGHTEEQLFSKPFISFVHPDDLAATVGVIERLASGDRVTGFENRMQAADGQFIPLSWNAVFDTKTQLMYATARHQSVAK